MAGKIILDEIEKSSTGTGIKLNSPLLSNTGVQIISESGTLGSTITFPSTIDNTTLGSGVTFPAGHVIKVTQGYTNSAVQKTSTGYIWENAASIQLTSINNKVLILLNAAFGHTNLNGGLKLHRNGSEFMPDLPSAYVGGATAYSGALNTADDSVGVSQAYSIGNYLFSYLDTPNTLDECFYSLYWYMSSTGGVNFNVQATDNGGASFSTMTLMEITV